MSDDVVVVGGGLGGCLAALTARERGATVRLLVDDVDTFRSASGSVDLLGATPDGEGPVARPLDRLGDVPQRHPYSRLGRETVTDALAQFDAALGDSYCGSHTDRNALLPTCVGTLRPSARYPRASAAGLASRTEGAFLVGFERVTGLDANLVGDRLSARLPYTVDGTTVPFPLQADDYPAWTRYARALDDNKETAGGTPVREALVETVRPYLFEETRVGFPAVLGLEQTPAIRDHLEDALGVDVFEIPIGDPSLPGIRLRRHLFETLDAAGVTIERESRVRECETSGDTVERIVVDSGETRTERTCSSLVLARGGVAAGGIEAGRSDVTEPLCGCHVPHPGARDEWAEADPLGDHAFARFGLRVDEQMRPLDANDGPEYENLYAVGQMLGGHDFTAHLSRSGIAVATGYAAGQFAGER